MAEMGSEKYSIEIPSVLAKLADVEKLSEKVSNEAGLPEEDMDNLAIAVTEAVNNSIKHGNDLDKKKKVKIDFVI
ncbi:MAG: ATP-binding protein, partial [bacterium]|nr:ATP-binding protein [bacterium]